MKNLITSLALLLASTVAIAQHSVTLTWTASVDTGGTVNVYRATSACAGGGTPSFVKLQSGVVAAGPYVDSTVGAGLFCYYVTALVNGVESLPSNTAGVTIVPAPPTALGGKQTASAITPAMPGVTPKTDEPVVATIVAPTDKGGIFLQVSGK